MKNSKKKIRQVKARRRKLPYILLSALLFGAIGTLLYFTSFAAEEIQGEWQVLCDVHHLKTDDPIVYPNQAGRSHMHSFYGNTTTDAFSTTATLMANKSNCGRNMETTDRSAYWVPSVYIKQPNGTLSLAPTNEQIAFIYYQRAGGPNGPKVLPFPNGLRMIAGNASATSSQPLSVVAWGCGGGGGGPQTAYIPLCPDPEQPIHATLTFPNCWNGRDLDSADHKSHMAYPGAGGICPGSHPVALPQLLFNLDYYGVKGGPDHVLASGGHYSMHGDFIAAWDVQVQNALVAECLNIPRSCLDINRDGDYITKPSYDPDPIPAIKISNYPSTPLTSGTLPPPPAPAPSSAAKQKAASPATTSSSAGTMQNGASSGSDAASSASGDTLHAAGLHAGQEVENTTTIIVADSNRTSAKQKLSQVLTIVAIIFGIGFTGSIIYFRLRRRV